MAEVLNHNQRFATPQEALIHYGVKGMKWGVRKDNRGAGNGQASGEGTVLAVYATVIAGLLIRQARHEYVDSGKRDAKRINKEEKKSGVKHEWRKKDSLKGEKSIDELRDEVMKPVNPGFPRTRGTTMNCRRCTFAYEMRRRGYDVKATKSLSATGQDQGGLMMATRPKSKEQALADIHASPWGKNVIHTRPLDATGKSAAIFDRLAREPNGSRGELAFSWQFGGGHSIAYEIVNNKPVIFDNQSSKSWSDKGAFAREVTPIMGDAAFTRLDNANLNTEMMRRWVTDAD